MLNRVRHGVDGPGRPAADAVTLDSDLSDSLAVGQELDVRNLADEQPARRGRAAHRSRDGPDGGLRARRRRDRRARPVALHAHSTTPKGMTTMAICDGCSTPIDATATRYPAARIHAAVRAGYRPTASIEKMRVLSTALGTDMTEMTQAWVRMMLGSPTDWLYCPTCAAELETFLARQAAAPPPRQEPRRGLFGRRR